MRLLLGLATHHHSGQERLWVILTYRCCQIILNAFSYQTLLIAFRYIDGSHYPPVTDGDTETCKEESN